MIKVYRNDSKVVLDVVGIGEIEPGSQVSISGDHMPAVILANYEGLVDVLAEEEAQAPAPAVDETQTGDTQNG